MKNMAYKPIYLNLKKSLLFFFLGIITAFIFYLLLMGIFTLAHHRDDVIMQHYSKCQSYKETIEKFNPINSDKFSNPSVETYNKAVDEFMKNHCKNFFPYLP